MKRRSKVIIWSALVFSVMALGCSISGLIYASDRYRTEYFTLQELGYGELAAEPEVVSFGEHRVLATEQRMKKIKRCLADMKLFKTIHKGAWYPLTFEGAGESIMFLYSPMTHEYIVNIGGRNYAAYSTESIEELRTYLSSSESYGDGYYD